MQRPEPNEYDPNYQKYFDLIPNGDYENCWRRIRLRLLGCLTQYRLRSMTIVMRKGNGPSKKC